MRGSRVFSNPVTNDDFTVAIIKDYQTVGPRVDRRFVTVPDVYLNPAFIETQHLILLYYSLPLVNKQELIQTRHDVRLTMILGNTVYSHII